MTLVSPTKGELITEKALEDEENVSVLPACLDWRGEAKKNL